MHVSSMSTRNGRNYEITLDVNFNMATVEVGDIETNEKWEMVFDSKYVEELTRKVGCLKKFPVFVSMLESAMKETSTSVSIQLLSHSDFEMFERRKCESKLSHNMSHSSVYNSSASKFLVLCHDGEFDSVRYPLILSYVGVFDVKILQEKIKKLQLEIATYRNQPSSVVFNKEVLNLKKEIEKLKKEKSDVENEFKEFKQVVNKRGKGVKESNRLSRNLVTRLEGDLRSEIMRHKTLLTKKFQENKAITMQVKRLKESESKLRTQVYDLKNEVSLLKRLKSMQRPMSSLEKHHLRTSWNSLPQSSRGLSRESCRRSSNFLSTPKARSLPSNSPARSLSSEHIRKSPDAVGNSRKSRFNPTAYIMGKKQRKLEVENKRNSSVESRDFQMKGSKGGRVRQGLHSSRESLQSNYSSRQRFLGHPKSDQNHDKFEVENSEDSDLDIDMRLAKLKHFLDDLP